MRRNYHFSLLKVCALCFAVQFSLQVPCACKAILIVFDNAGTLCMRTLRKKPTPGVFDYAGSHSAKRNLRDSARSRAFDNAGSHSAKRNLRDSARSRAFDNAGSLCEAQLARWTSFPGHSVRSRAGLVVSVNRQIRRAACLVS